MCITLTTQLEICYLKIINKCCLTEYIFTFCLAKIIKTLADNAKKKKKKPYGLEKVV
jgi:hypothetical protein